MCRLGEPARAGLGDDHVVFEADSELAINADGWLVRKGHAGSQQGLVALYEIGPFVHVQTDAVTGTVRQPGCRIAGAEAGAVDDAAGGDVDVLATVAGFGGCEARSLRSL